MDYSKRRFRGSGTNVWKAHGTFNKKYGYTENEWTGTHPNLALAGVDVIQQASLIKIAEEPEREQGLAQVAKEIKYQRKLIDIVAKPKML